MLKAVRSWLCILVVAGGLSLSWSISSSADEQTQTGITFVDKNSGSVPATPNPADPDDQDDTGKPIIPDGKKPINKDITMGLSGDNGIKDDKLINGGDAASKTENPNKTNSGQPSVKKVISDVTHALISGRLPQTNESQSVLVELVGLLLLIVLILSVIVYHQLRLLREKE